MQRSGFCGVMMLAGLLLLGGCVADYKRYSEEQFSFPPDLSAGCNFHWTAEKAYYRIADGYGFAWASVGERGHPALQPFMKELLPKCSNAAGVQTAAAHLSTHYLEYVNKDNRTKMMLPIGVFSLATAGYLPMEMRNFYVACVETTTPNGPRRAAVAHGVLEAVTNVWGASESLLHPGGTMRRYNREQLLRDLTRQAWHKLWTPGQGLAAGTGCRNTLDALLK